MALGGPSTPAGPAVFVPSPTSNKRDCGLHWVGQDLEPRQLEHRTSLVVQICVSSWYQAQQAILDAAEKVVIRDGAASLSLERVAKEAGIKKAACFMTSRPNRLSLKLSWKGDLPATTQCTANMKAGLEKRDNQAIAGRLLGGAVSGAIWADTSWPQEPMSLGKRAPDSYENWAPGPLLRTLFRPPPSRQRGVATLWCTPQRTQIMAGVPRSSSLAKLLQFAIECSCLSGARIRSATSV